MISNIILIVQEIDFEALCLWGGSECSFSDMVKFVSDRVLDPTTNMYWFGAQGLVAKLPNRLTLAVRTSVTILRLDFIVLKSIKRGGSSTSNAASLVFRAFKANTWY